MTSWVGVYRHSIAAVPPIWERDAEEFASITHALNVFTRRVGGKRPVPPPRRVAWDPWGNPQVLVTTRTWLLSSGDRTATLEMVALTSETTLAEVHELVNHRHTIVIRLNRQGHAIVTKPREFS